MKILNGIVGLASSRKGTLSLLILSCLSVLTFLGHIDGTAFSAGCVLISSVFCFTQSKTDCASMGMPSGAAMIQAVKETITGNQ